MNREEAKALLPVMQAFTEGKDIQFNNPMSGAGWIYTASPIWNTRFGYRIQPEKLEAWVNIHEDGEFLVYPSKSTADRHGSSTRIACIRIEYTPGEGL